MNRILGLNIGYSYIDDVGDLTKFHNELTPAYSVMFIDGEPLHLPENISKARALAATMPGTQWIYRVFNKDDGGFWLPGANGEAQIATPEAYMGTYGYLGQNGGILSLLNEPSGDLSPEQLDGMVRWVVKCMWIAIERGIRCCVVNWADRNPKPVNGRWHDRYREILQVGALRPDLFLMGLHLYGDDPISDVLTVYANSCKAWQIPVMPVVATEFGLDSTGGHAQGYVQHGYSGTQYAGWSDGQVNDALAPFIRDGVLVGLCTFAWNRNWRKQGFDVQVDNDWKGTILALASKGRFDIVPTQPPPTVVVELPDDAMGKVYGYVNSFGAGGGDSRPLRADHTVDAPEVARIVKKQTLVRRYSMPVEWGKVSSNGTIESKGRWNVGEIVKPVISGTGKRSYEVIARGWFCADGISWASESSVTTEVPVTPPPDSAGIPTPKPPEQVLTFTPAELQRMIKAEAVRLAIQVLTGMLAELTKVETTVAT